jgi:undecaprenyl-diphosphatase
MDPFEGLDWGTYYFFRFQANRAPDLQGLMQFGEWLGSYLATAIVLAAAIIATPRAVRWRTAAVIVLAFFAGALLVEGVKLAVARQRPPDAQNVLESSEMSAGFPSRAAFLTAFAWLVLAAALGRWNGRKAFRVAMHLAAAAGIVFVCLSQLWLGMHFVTDVLAGLAGGIGLALLASWAALEPGTRLEVSS